jgi:uncharacterized protein involved in tolerance to divalent cations
MNGNHSTATHLPRFQPSPLSRRLSAALVAEHVAACLRHRNDADSLQLA